MATLKLSNDTAKKIEEIVAKLMEANKGCGTTAFTPLQLQQLSAQMANGEPIAQEDILGLYDGSLVNSFTGKFSGILFLKDRIYVNLNKSFTSQCMHYVDMTDLSGDPSAFFATLTLSAKDGQKIVLKGLMYASIEMYSVFKNIIKELETISDSTNNASDNNEHQEQEKKKTVSNPSNLPLKESSPATPFVTKKIVPLKVLTPFQEKMFSLLWEYAFSEYDKEQKPPLSDWNSSQIKETILACEKISFFTWREYAFYTKNAMYYHCKKHGIHIVLYYENINDYDVNTDILNYGSENEKVNISCWTPHIKKFIAQIVSIKNATDESHTSTLEFCFNNNSDFKKDLVYFKSPKIKKAFEQQCQNQRVSNVLRTNFKHIEIKNMEHGKLDLQFGMYFPMVEKIHFSENDSEYEIEQKAQEQERLNEKYQKKIEDAGWTTVELLDVKDEIIKLFQATIYGLYGVLFKEENICYLEEPDFRFEEPLMIEKIFNKVAGATEAMKPYLADTAKRYAETAKKAGDTEKYEHYMDLHDKYQ